MAVLKMGKPKWAFVGREKPKKADKSRQKRCFMAANSTIIFPTPNAATVAEEPIQLNLPKQSNGV